MVTVAIVSVLASLNHCAILDNIALYYAPIKPEKKLCRKKIPFLLNYQKLERGPIDVNDLNWKVRFYFPLLTPD